MSRLNRSIFSLLGLGKTPHVCSKATEGHVERKSIPARAARWTCGRDHPPPGWGRPCVGPDRRENHSKIAQIIIPSLTVAAHLYFPACAPLRPDTHCLFLTCVNGWRGCRHRIPDPVGSANGARNQPYNHRKKHAPGNAKRMAALARRLPRRPLVEGRTMFVI